MEPKTLKSTSLYNKLQDLRHIILFDYRPSTQFYSSHIRDSQSLTAQSPEWEIATIINSADKKSRQMQEKYKTKKIRRIVLINSQPLSINDAVVKKWISRLSSDKQLQGYQLMIYGEQYEIFKSKYPFLCLADKEFYGGKLAEDQRSKSINLTEYQRLMLYSHSKFPSQIIQNKLYLGDIFNSNNQLQLKDLKIKTLIDLVGYNEGEEVPEFKKQFNYIHIPMNSKAPVTINFDDINEQIQAVFKDEKGPILMYCRDGGQFSSAFAIAYLMYKQRKPFQISSLKVFQALYSADICKWLYTQITVYNPKKLE